MNDQTSASQWEFPAVKEDDEDANTPQSSAVCQGNTGPLASEASSSLIGR